MNDVYLKLVIACGLIVIASSSFAGCDFEQPQDNLALVIGNSKYTSIGALNNPTNDAKAIAEVFRDYEYSVIERTDLSLTEMLDVITCFEDALKAGGVGVFYYAGHGVQLGQHNYLLPTDLQINEADQDEENQLRSKSVDFDDVLKMIKNANLATNIIILDACRNNPFKENTRGLFKGKVQRKLAEIAEHGFAEISELSAPPRSYIAFATGPGKTSSDGEGENGLFTSHLLKYMKNAELDISKVFARTTAEVYKASDQYQVPWGKTSLFDTFYFSPSHMRTGKMDINLKRPSEAPEFEKYFSKAKHLFHEKGRPKKALVYYKKSLKYAPENADVYYEMALANSNMLNYAEAIYLLKKAIKINPEHASAYSLLAHNYAIIGDDENAKLYLSESK